MKNKILLTLIIGIFLISLVSAGTSKDYDVELKQITINDHYFIDLFGWFDEPIATVKLDTPLVNYVIAGENRLVAQFTIDNYADFTDAVGNMELRDLNKNNEIITRTINYKYASYKNVEVNDYKTTCSLNKDNGFYDTNCKDELIGKHTTQQLEWKDFNEKTILPIGVITIGIFTDVYPNDNVEWIPNLYNLDITEWAVWTDAMKVGLKAYYKLDEGTGNTSADSWGTYPLTVTQNESWTTSGKINNAVVLNVTAGNRGYWNSSYSIVGLNKEIAVSVWFNHSGQNAFNEYITTIGDGVNKKIGMYRPDGTHVFIEWGGDQIDMGVFNAGRYNHLAYSYNGSHLIAWLNGVNVANYTVALDFSGGSFMLGNYVSNQNWDGYIDEVGIWNRTLSQSEINDLYTAPSFVGDPFINVTLNSPINNYQTISSSNTFNITATPTSPATLVNISFWNNKTGVWAIDSTAWKVVNDKSGNKNWGTPLGGVILNGSEGVFDGGNLSYINVPTITGTAFNVSNLNVTMCVWFNIKSRALDFSNSNQRNIIGSYPNGAPQFNMIWKNDTQAVQMILRNSSTTYSVSVATNSAPINQWNFFCVMKNDTRGSVWNGTNNMGQSTGMINNMMFRGTENLTIGGIKSTSFTTNVAVNGSIDEVRIYNTSLSASDISDIYNYGRGHIGSVPTTTGLVAYYDFDNAVDNNSSTSIFTSSFTTDGSYLWGGSSCDSAGYCQVSSENRTINILPTLINSVTYNPQSYETSSETYSINASGTLSSASLVYNGTSNTATISGDTASYTQTLPTATGNKSFYWSLNGGITNSSTYHQNVLSANLTICNYVSPINQTYINFTFKDESTNGYIAGEIPTSTFVYWLGDGSQNKTLTFINNTGNMNYPFCFTPRDKNVSIDLTMQYKNSTNYPQRTYTPSIFGQTNSTLQKILYLSSSTDGIYVTFQVKSSSGQSLSGVEVTGTRVIGIETATVAQGTTDNAGSVTFWLNPDYLHTFTFIKTGYDTQTESITPTQSTYTITMGGGSTQTILPDYSNGIAIILKPSGQYLTNGTHNFNYTISTTYWTLDSWGFRLKYGNGTIIGSQSSIIDTGGILGLNANTATQTRIIMDYYYVVNSTTINQTKIWQITIPNSYSIKNFFERFSTYVDANLLGIKGEDGTDTFGKALLSVLILVLVSGGIAYRYGIQSEAMLLGIIFGIVLFLNSMNFIPSPDFVTTAGVTLGDFLVYLTGIITIGFIIKEEQN